MDTPPDKSGSKRDPRPLSLYLVFLAFVFFPLAAAVLMIVSAVVSLVRGTNLLSALGRGALSATILVALIAVIKIIGSALKALLAKRNPSA